MRKQPSNAPQPIEVHELRKSFGQYMAVEDVSFTAQAGRVLGMLGPNGAGKTTTLRMLLGLASIDSGSASINGVPYIELTEPAKTVGALLDAGGVHPGRTGRQHLRIQATAAGIDPARVAKVLDAVGMTQSADRKVATYSLGMRQRIGVATAMLGDPQILILDEPANGLDPGGMRWMRELLRSFADEGRTVILASHVLGEVAQVADDLVIIGQGRVTAAGPLTELTAKNGGTLEDLYLDLTAQTAGVR